MIELGVELEFTKTNNLISVWTEPSEGKIELNTWSSEDGSLLNHNLVNCPSNGDDNALATWNDNILSFNTAPITLLNRTTYLTLNGQGFGLLFEVTDEHYLRRDDQCLVNLITIMGYTNCDLPKLCSKRCGCYIVTPGCTWDDSTCTEICPHFTPPPWRDC